MAAASDDPPDPDRTVYAPAARPPQSKASGPQAPGSSAPEPPVASEVPEVEAPAPGPADRAEPEAEDAARTVYAPVSRRTTTPTPPPAAPRQATQVEIGMVLNGIYAITRLIGRGGMGEVYEAVNISDAEDRVAIKVILPSLAADPNVQAMFFKEARALRQLSHAAVVQYRVATQEPSLGIFYIVTEFIDGPSLSELLGRANLSSEELRGLLRRLSEGLRAAHELGAVHRDMSPDNVLLPAGRLTSAKVIDFGIAKDLDTNQRTIIGDGFAGKLGYVAPEQLGDFGRDVGPWTDIYSLALVMLSLIHGRNVDMGATLVDAVDRRRAGVDVTRAPADLQPVLRAMLEADPARRLRSMDEVLAMLEGARPGPAPRPKPPPAKPARLSPLTLGLIGGGVLAVGTAAILAVTLLRPSGPHPAQVAVAGGAAAPAAAAAPSTHQLLLQGLPTIPCSWLRVASLTDGPGGASIKLSGVAGSTVDAQGAVSQLLRGAGARVSDLDFGDVGQISQPFCSAIDGFSAIRTDVDAAQARMTTAQTRYTMTQTDAGYASKAVVHIRIGDPSLALALVGVDETGKAEAFAPNRAYLSSKDAKANVEAGPGDSYTLTIFTDAGWSGLMLVTGRSAIDTQLLTVAPEKRDAAWRQRLVQAARAGGWQAEMVWYQVVKPS
ncbi:protein kinase domain-containing protein [Caulobacter sp. KR2-114]|uniref:serine/threonine-protein kinase n=1 Tax=Caulobacter sp. KR2-114 TaxID=3400912 RepID=UPI003C03090A